MKLQMNPTFDFYLKRKIQLNKKKLSLAMQMLHRYSI